ncbi:MAG TPA: hypothetical protein VM509_08010, partial [Planctomycetota bacterium]|nr:hypothetical protein [Planctomycetota bacterium]
DALIPGEQNTLAIFGTGLDLTTSVLLDGERIDPARYAILGSSVISLDMPSTSRLFAHELAVTNGLVTSKFPIALVTPPVARLELGNGNAFNVIDRDDGLSYVISGPVGSLQLVMLSGSSVPSANATMVLDIGNQFSDLTRIGFAVIPAQGWLRVHVPSASLPTPPAAGMPLFSQAVELVSTTPYRASNAQSIWLIP